MKSQDAIQHRKRVAPVDHNGLECSDMRESKMVEIGASNHQGSYLLGCCFYGL